MREASILREVMLAIGAGAVRLFRNNQGAAWQGTATRLQNGDVLLRNPRRVVYGVGNPGGSDLIGWRTVEVTPEMVGRKLAVFCAVEVKSSTGRASEDQKRFLDAVRSCGGIGVEARSAEGAAKMVMGPPGC